MMEEFKGVGGTDYFLVSVLFLCGIFYSFAGNQALAISMIACLTILQGAMFKQKIINIKEEQIGILVDLVIELDKDIGEDVSGIINP